jgi:methylated-DNA-[protein]-cysteine S-methyltransferase
LVALRLVKDVSKNDSICEQTSASLPEPAREAVRQLEQYFAGARREFTVPLSPQGTPFQLAVWDELQRIPYGTTITYGELAARLGDPKAIRAVGRANGANPIWIIIPCHRVIGADGSLTGYAGGIDVKRALLELEGALKPRGGGLFD